MQSQSPAGARGLSGPAAGTAAGLALGIVEGPGSSGSPSTHSCKAIHCPSAWWQWRQSCEPSGHGHCVRKTARKGNAQQNLALTLGCLPSQSSVDRSAWPQALRRRPAQRVCGFLSPSLGWGPMKPIARLAPANRSPCLERWLQTTAVLRGSARYSQRPVPWSSAGADSFAEHEAFEPP